MALTLTLETSSVVCSVAVHKDGNILAVSEIHKEHSHASKLAILIQETVSLTDHKLNDLDAVAVSAGPGSYTGLRIGTATAKGICFSLNIPLISFGTLDLLVHRVMLMNISNALLCPMIDARRMEVYCKLVDGAFNDLKPVEAKVIDESSFNEELQSHKIVFFGDGAVKCRDMIQHPNAFFLEGIYPSASTAGFLVTEKFQRGEFEPLSEFEPFYLKDFQAKKARTFFESQTKEH